MPLSNPSREPWRLLKSRLRLLKRPQAWGTATVLLAAGVVLTNYWMHPDRWYPAATPSAPPSVPTTDPVAPAPAIDPSGVLPGLTQPEVEISPTAGSLSTQPSDRPSSQAEQNILPHQSADLLGSPVVRSPAAAINSATASSTDSTLDRSAPSSGYVFGIDNFLPASPAATPADSLRTAMTSQTGDRNPTIVPAPAIRSPQPPSLGSVTPYQTSPPPGTTGYVQPPSLTPIAPTSGLPASRPDLTGQPANSVYGSAPLPSSIGEGAIAPLPNSLPGQTSNSGEINTFANP